MANHFYAYISRMRCVKRWALMRNTCLLYTSDAADEL